jgi:hypothetical protein
VCPSCNTRRMVETAAHLCDHVFPRLPVRQWVLSVPKRLRYFMQRDGAVLNMVLRIFLRVIAQSLQTHSPGAANVDKATLHIGAVAFIHRFGSSLNAHVHFHVCVVDGVFEEIPVAVVGQTDVQSSPPGIVFHPASAIDETAVAQVQTDLRRRILRAFVGRGLIEKADAKEMLAYQHSGFSVDAGVCIEADDRAALERLLRYCARPPFAMERLRKEGAALVYRCAKQRSEPTSDKRGAKVDELHLTALELIDRIAALVPPPRTHRHRYFGVLAPNSPLRSAVTAMADAQPDATGDDAHRPAPLGNAISPTPEPVPTKRPAHYLWAVLIARIYEVFPLLCPLCGGQMRLIAFVTEGRQIRRILDHIGVDSEPPHIAPARGPPLWDDCGDAQMDDGAQTEPDWATDWDGAAQPVPDFEVDQRPFAMERLRKEGAALVYRCAKQRSEPTSDKRGAKVDELHLTALELIDRIAALVPPPRTHRHRYFGVLAPNSPHRAAVTALATPAQPAKQVVVQTDPATTGEGAFGVAPLGNVLPSQSGPAQPVPPKRPAHYLWAVLIARIYEVLPLLCPKCGGQMRLIAFITDGVQIKKILDHIGEDSDPPHISPARGPPLWDDCSDAQTDEGVHIEPDWDLAAQPAPDFEVDQRVSW